MTLSWRFFLRSHQLFQILKLWKWFCLFNNLYQWIKNDFQENVKCWIKINKYELPTNIFLAISRNSLFSGEPKLATVRSRIKYPTIVIIYKSQSKMFSFTSQAFIFISFIFQSFQVFYITGFFNSSCFIQAFPYNCFHKTFSVQLFPYTFLQFKKLWIKVCIKVQMDLKDWLKIGLDKSWKKVL